MDNYEPRQVEEQEHSNCKNCGKRFKVTSTNKEYCSVSCGYINKLATKYNCPVCNTEVYSMGCDPYCSNKHRKQAVDNYNYHKECRVCGSLFYGTEYDYTCSDYCEEQDNYGV